jgi:hypothetical protein
MDKRNKPDTQHAVLYFHGKRKQVFAIPPIFESFIKILC